MKLAYCCILGCLASACGSPTAPAAAPASNAVAVTFAPGSLIVPMDTTYQDDGTLKAFGLLYQLLQNDVPVQWVIEPAKPVGGIDFTATVTDLQTGTPLTADYRGGPFVVDSVDRTDALPIITAWQAANVTTVHDATAAFTANVVRTLTAAPRIGVFADTYELIAFQYFNAAGIPDSDGQVWPAANDVTRVYPGYQDVLDEPEIAGPTTGNHEDGALFVGPLPFYCQLTSMHYDPTPQTPEVTAEVRAWLSSSPVPHAFMQCEAAETFENEATSGHLVSTLGIVDDGVPAAPFNNVPDDTFAQYDGTLTADTGAFESAALAPGSAFHPGVRTLINQTAQPLDQQVLWLTGNVDGDPLKGKVTYLGGHNYSFASPISTNPMTNGARLFLNSFFESNCVSNAGQPIVELTKTAPVAVAGTTITFTLDWNVTGPGFAESVTLVDPLPPGTDFVSATGGGVLVGTDVVWDLGHIVPSATGSRSLTVRAVTPGTYSNQAAMSYRIGTTTNRRIVPSNPTDTLVTPNAFGVEGSGCGCTTTRAGRAPWGVIAMMMLSVLALAWGRR